MKYFILGSLILLSGHLWAQKDSTDHFEIGLGKGIQFIDSDSTMSLKLGFRFQSLFTAARDIKNPEGSNDWTTFIQLRRFRIKLDGWVMNPNLIYKLELGFSNRDMSPSQDFTQVKMAPKIILDAVIKWKFSRHLTLWVGQTKVPGNRQRMVSSQKLQFVDRSIVNGLFNLDRDIGVQLRGKYQIGQFTVAPMFAVTSGDGRNFTIANIGGMSYSGRLDILPFGEFSEKGDYFESDHKREQKPKLALGIAYDYNDGASRTRGRLGSYLMDTSGNILTTDLSTFFADLHFKYMGFSFFGEYALRTSDKFVQDVDGGTFSTGQGLNLQAAYLFKKDYEVALRFALAEPDKNGGFNYQKYYTLGLSKYLKGHTVKVQTDLTLVEIVPENLKTFLFRLQVELGI